MDARKYINDVAFRTYFNNTTLNTLATSTTPALWDTTIYPIDVNEKGASPMILEVGFWGISNAGYFYLIKAINVDSNPHRITVEDTFFSGYAPTGGLRGIIYKSAYKGYAFAIAPVWLSQLDNIARDYVNSLEKSILWQNDSNAIRIPITETDAPAVENYQYDQVVSGKTVNLQEDFDDNPGCDLYQQKTDEETGDVLELKRSELASRVMVDGKISRIHFGGLGDIITGFILIYRQ